MNTVIDRVVQYPHRYQLKNVNTDEILGTFDLEPITGTVSVVGTKIDKELFDSIASDISARLVSNGGDAKDNIITYTMPSDRNNIVSGEKLSVSFGKIAKYINDLKAVAFSGNKSDIGLGNVDNTSDKDKPISNATQQALDLKADKKDVSEVDIDLEGTGTIVSIPENATGYGTIEKLGGKTRNTIMANNSVLSNVSTGDTAILWSQPSELSNGIEYTISYWGTQGTNLVIKTSNYGIVVNIGYGESIKFTFTDNVYFWYIYTTSDLDTANWIWNVDVMNDVPSNYESNVGLNIYYPTNVKVVGRNLCNGSLFVDNKGFNSYGVIVSASGYKATEEYISIKPNTTYTITNGTVYGYTASKTFDGFINSNTFTTKSTISYIRIESKIGNNAMLVEGSTALPYTPYTEQNLPQTNIINYVSTQLQTNHSWTSDNASKWLGLGVGNDSNIINYANNKKGIVKYSILDLGTLDWHYDSKAKRFYAYDIPNYKSNDSYSSNGLCAKYEVNFEAAQKDLGVDIIYWNVWCFYSVTLYIRDNSYTDADTFKNAMSGVMLIYELATPIEIDLSSLETEEHFECESNGSIIHDNIANYKYSFPVSLKGQVELNFEHDKEQQRDIDSLKKEIDLKANNSELSNVAKSGSYNDLLDKPTIPVTSVNGKTGAVVLSASDIGLGNVNNTSDADKPISTATQNALNNKANSSDLNAHTGNTNNPHNVTKAQLGLEKVDNTSDSEKNVASAKILKNNEIGSFTLSSGFTSEINFNSNSVYLIYNNIWNFIIRTSGLKAQSTVCYNKSDLEPLWFEFDNTAIIQRLYLKTLSSNSAITYSYNGTFNYKLLATDK